MKRVFATFFSMALLGWLLAGCAGPQRVENNVTAFHTWQAAPPGPGTPYRFERLPSQQVSAAYQDRVEDAARIALGKVGMELRPAAARYSVQVGVTAQLIQAPYGSGYDGFGGFGFGGPGVFLGGGNRGAAFGLSFPFGYPAPSPYYHRNLTLLIRDIGSQQIVFETRASNDSIAGETPVLLAAMLDAALLGFPQPPAGPRRIVQ